jgi:hypothetical protein
VSVEPTSQPETHRPESKSSSFWTSLPGLLTAVAGLLTAILAVCTFLYQIAGPGKDDDASASANGPSSPKTASNPGQGQSPSPSPAAGGGDAPLWHGTMLLTNYGIDFDQSPPKTKPESGIDVYDAADFQVAVGGSDALIAKWTGGGTPTAADCYDLLSREGVDKTQKYFQGAQFCVRTNGSRMIVLIKFLGPKSGEYQIEATVWAPRD